MTPDRLADRPAVRFALGVAIVGLIGAALVGLAVLPTGESTAARTVPADARIVLTEPLDDARVFLLSQRGRLRLLVAYHTDKGWLSVSVAPAPAGPGASWASTDGNDEIPPFSAVYGRAEGAKVRVRWHDGRESRVDTERDGSYLVVRAGRQRAAGVTVVAPDGTSTEMPGP